MSTAILTWASRCVITLYNQAGTALTANSVTLQAVQVSPDRTLSPIDMTNTESGGLSEWAPGVTMTEIELSGILDANLSFVNLVFIQAMDNKNLVQIQFYFTKPVVGAGANNPAVLTGKALMTNCKITDEITAQGSVMKFSGKARIIGSFALTGKDVTSVQGFVQN